MSDRKACKGCKRACTRRLFNQRLFDPSNADPVAGDVVWSPRKIAYNGGMTAAALILGPLTFNWPAFLMFLCFYAFTLCFGQSIGLHRLLIHRSFQCPLWLERTLIYFGTVAGLQGPYAWIRNHDLRDWAQQEPACHPYLSQQGSVWQDYISQIYCVLQLKQPPKLELEPSIADDKFYQFLEKYFYFQQIPVALMLYAVGGLPFVVWGVCVRVACTVTGTWYMLYQAHNEGSQTWLVQGAGIQGYNVAYSSWLSMGEAWHNNHHAYPKSARFGMGEGQADPAWSALLALSSLGLVRNIETPETVKQAKVLVPVAVAAGKIVPTR